MSGLLQLALSGISTHQGSPLPNPPALSRASLLDSAMVYNGALSPQLDAHSTSTAALWVKKVGVEHEVEVSNFLQTSANYPQRRLFMGAKRFNFAFKFPQNGGFSAPNFAF